MKPFVCLGIETSCDETSAAVVADGMEVRSNVVQTQLDRHGRFGGIVPELACRAHIETLLPVVDQALSDAGMPLAEVDAIAATHTPGLVGALLIGVAAAKGLALAARKPLIGVDHIHAHAYACRMAFPKMDYPCLSFIVSGGHTSLYLSKSAVDHELMGSTRDDAAGEAFDKVARILGLSYPGGPVIDRLARSGNPKAVPFRRTTLEKDTLDFSFSGIKTAVLYHVRGQDGRSERTISEGELADLAASFQEAVVDVLVEKALRAAALARVNRIAVGGGVACNSRLREKLTAEAAVRSIEAFFPPLKFCTDNAAMVAGMGFQLYRAGRTSDLRLDAVPTRVRELRWRFG